MRRALLCAAAGLVMAALSPALAQEASAPASRPAPIVERPADPRQAGLWDLAAEAEQDARESAQLNTDPALNAYLREVACRVAAEYCNDIRLYVMNRPYFNAMMAPNGYMEIWSGLLLRADNEAEAAFVIGHEIGHFTQSHSIQMQEVVRERMTAALIIGMATGLGDLASLGAMASLFGFSREMEVEADQLGFERARAAGYDPSAGAALWRHLIAETQASDSPRTRRSVTRGSIFDTHPVTTERVEDLDALAEATGSGGALHRDRYRAAIRPFLGLWLADDLRRRDFGQTLHLIARLGAQGEDAGVLSYYRGETYRLRRQEGDLALAAQAYAEAVTHADAPPEAWRELGGARLRAGDQQGAADAFARYLALAPEAEDRALIEQDLLTLPPAAASSSEGGP